MIEPSSFFPSSQKRLYINFMVNISRFTTMANPSLSMFVSTTAPAQSSKKKKIKISVDQITDVVLYSLDKYTKTVFIQEFMETTAANSSFSKSSAVTPLLAANCKKQGLALDGRLKHGDTNLASSMILRPGMNKELLGILVSYKVRVNLMVSRGGILGDLTASDVAMELPLILMHPKPYHEAASSEDRLIKEFTRQEPCKEESQETLAEEGDEGSGAPGSGACVGVLL
ncbi:arrestin-C [Desmodus rotundus]|uniref:arrestin-C n=1 Tax=Desmodus rotundus TaxID=9430 RepID=UPI0023813EC7|nr:arrestin-C [Desmodus rotundus]